MSKRVLQGVVVGDACNKTVTCGSSASYHPVYKKFVTHIEKVCGAR